MAVLFYDMNENKWYIEKADGEQEAYDSYAKAREAEEEPLEIYFPQLQLQLLTETYEPR